MYKPLIIYYFAIVKNIPVFIYEINNFINGCFKKKIHLILIRVDDICSQFLLPYTRQLVSNSAIYINFKS